MPEPTPGQVLVRVRSVGICGSDVHYYLQGKIGDAIATEPHIMGHEFAGEVAALGEGVQNLAEGQRVAVEPAIPCGQCEMCLEGHPNLCLNIRFMSVPPEPGALAEYVVVDAERCFPLPDCLSAEDGAMLEPLGVALHTMRLAKMLIGDTVAIVGCGAIGLLILQLARASGALFTVATDKLDSRLHLARHLGAALTVNITQADPTRAVREFTNGRGVDIAIEAAGEQSAPNQAASLARNGGKLLLVGIPPEDEFTLTASLVRRKGLTIKMVRRMKHTYTRAIALAAAGRVDLRTLVTHRFSLEEVNEAFDLVAHQADDVVRAMVEL